MMRLVSLLLFLCPLLHNALAANYRLQSTTYAVTIKSSLASKKENCQKSFGTDAFLFDLQDAKKDFSDQEEFNEALTGVFFKSPNGAFFVANGGTDRPPKSDDGHHYVLKTQATPHHESLDAFGNAVLESFPRQAQILCGVPMKEYQEPKAYTSPEEESSSKGFMEKSKTGFFVLVGLVGLALLVRKKVIDYGAYAPLPSQQLQHARMLNPFDDPAPQGDMQESLMTSVELQSSLT